MVAQRRFSFAQGILSFAQGNSQSSQRSPGDVWLVRIPARVYCLSVLNKLCFLMSKTYLWLHNIEKDFYKLLQIL